MPSINMTFHVVGDDRALAGMMQDHGFCEKEDMKHADIIMFPGGADVNPELYGEPAHPRTYCTPLRDLAWQKIYHKYKNTAVIFAGICGGGQFLNVMSGGRMWQDVDSHAIGHTHPLMYRERDHLGNLNLQDPLVTVHQVTSTHHQMMRPSPKGMLWGYCNLSRHRDAGTEINKKSDFRVDGPDVEIVFYPDFKTLCFQPHPEYLVGIKECRPLFFKCLARAITMLDNISIGVDPAY